MKRTVKTTVVFLLITTLLILGGCSKSKAVPVYPIQQDNSNLPQVNVDAFRGLGRLAFVWNGLLYVLDGDKCTLTKLSDASQVRWPKWSPDGQWLAYIRYSDNQMNDGKLLIVSTDGSKSHEVTGLSSPVNNSNGISWLPTSDVLVVKPEGQGLYMVRPGETPRKANDNPGFLSPDGKTMAYVKTLPYDDKYPEKRSDALYVVPVEGGESVQLYIAKEAGIHFAGWWPDHKGLLFRIAPHHSASIMSDGTGLYSLPLNGGEPRLLTTSLKHPEWLSWSPDGSELLAVKGTGREIWQNKSLVVCDVKTGKNTDLPQRPNTVSLDPDWSPDGKSIAYVEAVERKDIKNTEEFTVWEQTRTLWVADADGKNTRQINEAGTGISRPLWSRDGSHIIYLKDNSIWLVNINGESPVKLVGPFPDASNSQGYYGYVSWSNILALYRQ